jgi:glycosyltransferase involved in cell wall biosynthesis
MNSRYPKPSICFVALKAYNLLSGRKDIKHTGGAEVQQVRIASWLVQKGYSVSFVTLDHGQPNGIEINGIKVFKSYAKQDGIRGLRFVHPRWSRLWAAMTCADADVYYQRGPECETGQVALWCYLNRKKFIFAAANAVCCNPHLLASEPLIERVLYRIGIKLAHAVTAQTVTQQDLLLQNMYIKSVLVRNCGWTLTDEYLSKKAPNNPGTLQVLWIGRINEQKRLELLLDVAEQCPEIMFDIVGAANVDSNYAASMIKRATQISNVKLHNWVPYAEIPKYYQNCHILCCTSEYEGFPNTFLEAWAQGIPVISTVDPDNVIVSNGLGFLAKDVEGIVACLKKITQSGETWLKLSKAAQQYYILNHTPEVCLPKFERMLLEVTGFEVNPT